MPDPGDKPTPFWVHGFDIYTKSPRSQILSSTLCVVDEDLRLRSGHASRRLYSRVAFNQLWTLVTRVDLIREATLLEGESI